MRMSDEEYFRSCVARERQDQRLLKIVEACRERGVRVRSESREQLTLLARNPGHQGVVAFARERSMLDIEDLLGHDALATGAVPLLLAAVSLRLGAWAAGPALVVGALTVTRIGGSSIGALVQRRARWALGTRRGRRSGRHAVHGPVDGPRWPAPVDGLVLLEVADGRGGRFGVVQDPGTGLLSATLLDALVTPILFRRFGRKPLEQLIASVEPGNATHF